MTHDYWASIACSIDESLLPGNPGYRRTLLAKRYINSKLGRKGRLLDCGCGTGASLEILADQFDSIYACDCSSGMLGIAANRLRTIDKISLLHWDITQPFPVKNWQMVDVVTLFSVLPYVRNWDGFFTELQKVLKPGGIFIASFPNQLFDLYSLNSLTKDLFLSELVDPLVDPNVREDLVCTLKKRLGEPAAFPENSAYKNVDLYFKRANPLTISKELAPYGIQIERIYYMNNHPVPPSCDMRFGENLLALRKKRELDLDYEHWSQMFTNSTFLVAGEFRRFC